MDELNNLNLDKENYLLPALNLNEKIILNIVYNINNWDEVLYYINKYKNLLNKRTLNRIIKFSWYSFYDTYKINLNLIINIYEIYYKIINKNPKNIDNIIYYLKNNNLKKTEIYRHIYTMLEK